jgi:FAD/FMN-containing dehydrogenase
MIPAGVREADFRSALREFADAVGNDWVFSRPEDVALYDDAYSPFVGEPDQQRHASAALAPTTVEQVQRIVAIANRRRIPLYATSTGRNLGYGGAAPVYSGSVVVDLKRMNRVIEVSEEGAYALIEPGVSYLELYRYLEDRQLPFMVSTAEPGWGSPIGNALDHGTSQVIGDNFGMVHGLEVVLPNGEVLRTGMGASVNSRLWQNYRYGFGPYIDGMFSQSNFGIVTKMGFWLVRKPAMQTMFVVSSFKHEDLHPLVNEIQKMREQGLLFASGAGSPIRSSMSSNNGQSPQGIDAVNDLLARRDGGAPADWEQLGRQHSIPVSAVNGSVRGPVPVVKGVLEHAREVFAQIPGATFRENGPYTFPVQPAEVPESQKSRLGIPNLWAFSQPGIQGTSHGHYFFSPVFKATADDIFAINDTIRNVMLDAGDLEMLRHLGWGGGAGFYPKAYFILLEFMIRDDVALNRRRRELFQRLVDACGAKGWNEYRAPPAFQDMVMDKYSFNNHALRRFHEAIKDAIDPNGILSPGKSGIWPRHLRKT